MPATTRPARDQSPRPALHIWQLPRVSGAAGSGSKGQGADARALDGGQRADASGSRGSLVGAAGLAQLQGGRHRWLLPDTTGSWLAPWLWLWPGLQRRSRSRSSGSLWLWLRLGAGELHLSVASQEQEQSCPLRHRAPATAPRGCPARAQPARVGVQQQPPRQEGCRARVCAPGGVGPSGSAGPSISKSVAPPPVLGRSCCRYGCRCAAVANAWPRCPQNLQSSLYAQHIWGSVASGAPQSLQHLAPRGFRWRRRGQFKLMGLPC